MGAAHDTPPTGETEGGRGDGGGPELTALFDNMMQILHETKDAQFRIEIMEKPQIQQFISKHAALLDSSFQQVPMSQTMRSSLQRSDYIFSGIKTFHELNEAFPALLDENGNRKSFEHFLNDVRKIDQTYNRNYLRAEYNFCQTSAAMAAKWEEFMRDGDRYNLQYRTQRDKKVRPEHAALDRVTLPPTDPFWEKYFPPNGWGCRCTVVQVRKKKYPVTPSDDAIRRGEEATAKDKRGVFNFNPGIQRKTFPDYNPYTIKRCRDCDIAKGKLNLAYVPKNELCEACKLLHELQERERQKRLNNEERSRARDYAVAWADRHLPSLQLFSGESKRLLVVNSETGDEIIVNKKFFSETYAKNIRNRKIADTMHLTTLVNEWLPNAEFITEEEGIHHPYPFKVFHANYQGHDIECKAKVLPDGIYLYTMRIIQ